FLLHGKYCNPSLALALPISGSDVFCAYPPLYQLALLGWMGVFGTSAISAMGFHLLLFGLCLLLLLAIFRRLAVPVWLVNVAAAFLRGMTFQDRPDSLAHVFGLAAVYAWVRSQRSFNPGKDTFHQEGDAMEHVLTGRAWTWATVGFVILGLGT